MKRIYKIIFRTLLILGIVFLGIFSHFHAENTICKELSIDIDYQANDPMFDKIQIRELLSSNFTKLIGTKMGDLPLVELETFLNDLPEVKIAEVYTTIFGKLGIHLIQRYPIAAIFTEGGNSYYLDKDGVIYKAKFPGHPRIMIFNGSIPRNIQDTSKYSQTLRRNISLLANSINNSEFLKILVEEVYVLTKNEYEIIPKIGKQIIKLGDINNLDKKLSKLELLYAKGMTAADGWTKYKTIDLQFKGQIVCSK